MAKENKDLAAKIGEHIIGGFLAWCMLTAVIGSMAAMFALGVGLLFLTVTKAIGLAISTGGLMAIVFAIWLTNVTKRLIRDTRAKARAKEVTVE